MEEEAFVDKLGPYFGEGVTRAELLQLFTRIDADCGGSVSWFELCRSSLQRFADCKLWSIDLALECRDEFTGYMLQQDKGNSSNEQLSSRYVMQVPLA